jgi:hypothetical protein
MKGIYRLKPNFGTHWFREANGKETPIKSGETIECEAWQLGGAIGRFEIVQQPTPTPHPSVGLKKIHRGAGRFDVVNEATGKPINSRMLSGPEADELIADGGPMEGALDEDEDGPAKADA